MTKARATALPHLAVIGGGNMASAILSGAFDAGLADPERVVVADPSESRRMVFRHAVADAAGALEWLARHEPEPGSGQVLLAVKPQILPEVAAQARAALEGSPRRVVISILAGLTTARVAQVLGVAWPVVRVMPNTPAQVRLGMSALCLGASAAEEDARAAEALFAAVGETVRLEEALMDAFTAVAGSGPAYLFYLAEAMAAAGAALGIEEGEADRIVRQTLLGSATLLSRDARAPGALRAAVTSRGGTTAAATGVMDASGFAEMMHRALAAARDRGRTLSEG